MLLRVGESRKDSDSFGSRAPTFTESWLVPAQRKKPTPRTSSKSDGGVEVGKEKSASAQNRSPHGAGLTLCCLSPLQLTLNSTHVLYHTQ